MMTTPGTVRALGCVLAAAAALISLAPVWARPQRQTPPPDGPRSLAEILEPIRVKHAVPALAAALVRDGRIVAIGAVGTRRAGTPDPVTPDDLWHLGSCTKAMTATLIARLVEKGTLSWTTTLPEAFPDLKDMMDPAWRSVTLELLLANRAGVSNDLARDEVWARLRLAESNVTDLRGLVVESVVSHPPAYEPGTRNLYSNTGYIMAGHAAEVATGRTWEDLMRAEVFEPLGMTGAGFGPPGKPVADAAPDQPRGHRGDKPVEPSAAADNPPALGPAGTVHASLPDWSRFGAALVRGARGEAVAAADGLPFLSPDSFRKLHTPIGTPPAKGYALGWSVDTRPWARCEGEEASGRVLVHNGSNTMWYCVTWLAPERNAAILVVCNTAGTPASEATDAVAGALARSLR